MLKQATKATLWKLRERGEGFPKKAGSYLTPEFLKKANLHTLLFTSSSKCLTESRLQHRCPLVVICSIWALLVLGEQLRGRSQEANQFWCAFTSSGRADKREARPQRDEDTSLAGLWLTCLSLLL